MAGVDFRRFLEFGGGIKLFGFVEVGDAPFVNGRERRGDRRDEVLLVRETRSFWSRDPDDEAMDPLPESADPSCLLPNVRIRLNEFLNFLLVCGICS